MSKLFFPSLFTFVMLSLHPPVFTVDETKEQITEDDASDWNARMQLAKILTYQKQYEEALIEYQKLLKSRSNNPTILLEIARIHYYQGNYPEALTTLYSIPNDQVTDDSNLLLADISLAQKDYTKAASLFQNYLEKHPKSDVVRLKLAQMFSWEKKYDESVSQYQIILEHRPNDIQVRRKYAQVLIWMGKEKEAAEELRKTLKEK